MRRPLALAFLAFALALLAYPAHAQTTLSMQARWDNNSAVQGTVTLSQMNSTGSTTVVATQTLSKGRASLSVSLAANTLYYVTLLSSTGTQLVNFPLTTALINPTNLSSADVDFVIHAANNALASARIQVAMSF